MVFARQLEVSGGRKPIFLAAPRLDAPGFSIAGYLARVLADAQRKRETFWPDPK